MTFVALCLLSQLVLLAAVLRLTGGREFTLDAPMLMGLARHPLEVLGGRTATYGQHPPLLGLLIAAAVLPASWAVSDMAALRLGLVVWSAIGCGFAWAALRALVPAHRRRWALVAVVVLPTCWYTPVVAAQDEVIAAVFVVAVLWLVGTRRWPSALVLCGVGVAAGKIFLAVPLLALVVLVPWGTLLRRAAAGLVAPAAAYGWVTLAALTRGQHPPLVTFDPSPTFGVNGWTLALFHTDLVSLQTARRVSELLVAVVVICLLLGVGRRRLSPSPARLWALVTAALLWTWVVFYHVDPEYYALTNVALIGLALMAGRAEQVVAVALTIVPWITRILYEADIPTGRIGEKARITRLVDRAVPGSVHAWYLVSLWTCTLITVAAAVLCTRLSLRPDAPAGDASSIGDRLATPRLSSRPHLEPSD